MVKGYRSMAQPGTSRGTCLYCGRTYLLTVTGHLRRHIIVGGPPSLTGKPPVCEGSGRLPRRDR